MNDHDDHKTHGHDEHDKHDKHDHDKHLPGRAIVALFKTRAEGREAIAALHKAHYKTTWLGTTSVAHTNRGDEAVTVESGGFFFGTQTLADALVSRGVLGETARRLESEIEPGNALVTVDPKDDDQDEAMAILESFGGDVVPAATSGRAPVTGTVRRTDAAGQPPLGDDEWEEMLFERRRS